MANLRQLILFNQQNKKQCEHALDIRYNELNAYFKKLVLVLKYFSIFIPNHPVCFSRYLTLRVGIEQKLFFIDTISLTGGLGDSFICLVKNTTFTYARPFAAKK